MSVLPSAATATTFTFTAAGDYEATSNTDTVLQTIKNAAPNFHIALGDFRYTSKTNAATWATYVKSFMGSIPFEILPGNHDVSEIDAYAAAFPNAMSGLQGEYGKEYYFDYPASSPIARFIQLAPNEIYTYSSGSTHYNFVSIAIDDARAQGIRWIVVSIHKNCITAGEKGCEIGSALFNLLLNKKVDLILQGHEHAYERSKQLTCATIGSYSSSCVSAQGNSFVKGRGSIIAIIGTGGIAIRPINTGDAEYGYFAVTDDTTFGIGKFTVSDTVMTYSFVRSGGGSLADAFTITDSASALSLTPQPTALPGATPTFVPGGVRIALTLFLHGIGLGGDNINPASTGNSAPLHQSRIVTITLLDTKGIESVRQGIVQYDSASGSFKGVIDLGNIPDDQYIIKVKSDMYLARRYNGMYALSSSQTRQMPNAFLIAGDANEDNRLSIYDYNLILDCYSDTVPARNCTADKKLKTDLTDDGFVNHFDYNLFLRELSVQVGDEIPTITPQPTPTKAVTPTPTKVPTPTPTRLLTPTPTRIPPTATLVPTTGSGTYPSNILNLQNWKLTLPTGSSGSPTEIKQPTLTNYINDPWFIPVSVPEGGIVYRGVRFRAPVNGVTTSGSSYPRSELREMTNNGTANAAWSTSTGTHTMFIEQAITAIPQSKQHVVAGQVHDSGDDVIVIRLEYPKLFIDIGGSDGPTLDANYVLGKKFTVKFVVNGGKTSIYYNNSTTPAYVLSKSYSGAYFKAGAYAQANCSTESVCSANNYGEVVIYQLEVTHQ